MDRTIALIRRSHEGDQQAKAQLVKENTGLVWCVAKRYFHRGTEAEDLFQVGSIGLLKAIDKFDLSFDVKFSTYAVPMISGEIRRFLRDDGMLRVSRSLKELAYHACRAKERLQERCGCEPTVSELAEELGVAREELVMAMEAGSEIESLYQPIYQKDGQEIRLQDKLAAPAGGQERVLEHMMLGSLLETLGARERRLIWLRYFAERTQAQAGQELGISQVQVSRMEKRILRRLRQEYFGEE